jgi:hypothetical protein
MRSITQKQEQQGGETWMADREKVIERLEYCAGTRDGYVRDCINDALALLKEQEEKLKFLDALYNYINPNDMEKYMQMYKSLPIPSDGRSVKWDE